MYRVVLGEHDMTQQEGTEQIRDVMRIVVHPMWDIDHVADGWVYFDLGTRKKKRISLLKINKEACFCLTSGILDKHTVNNTVC